MGCKFQFWVRGTQVGGLDYLVRCLPSRPNHLRNIYSKNIGNFEALTLIEWKNCHFLAVTENLWFLRLVLESMTTPIRILKIKLTWFFSCLFTFYSNFSKICWKNKCYKNQVPTNKMTLLRCLDINFYINFQNQLKKVWDTAIWGQNSLLNFHQISTFLWKLRPLFWPQMAVSQTFFNWFWKFI